MELTAEQQRVLGHALDVLGQSPSVLSVQPYELAAEWYAEVRSALRDIVQAFAGPREPHAYDPDSHEDGRPCTYCGQLKDHPVHNLA